MVVHIRTFSWVGCLLLVAACAGAHHRYTSDGTHAVYRVDEGGNKTLVYAIDPSGRTTFDGNDDSGAQPAVDALEQDVWLARVEAERIRAIQNAPKRRAGDRVYVALHDVRRESDLPANLNAVEALDAEFRAILQKDPAIQVVGDDDLDKADAIRTANVVAGMSPNRAPVADVTIASRAFVEEALVLDVRSGQPGPLDIVVIEATVTSNFLPMAYTVREQGVVYADAGLGRRLARRVIHLINQSIAPTLPTDRNL